MEISRSNTSPPGRGRREAPGEGPDTSPPGRGRREAPGEGRQVPDDLLQFARSLRTHQTDAETRLWSLLRNRRLVGMKFRRQHPIQPYVVDFYCHEARLVIEVDGGQHADNRLRDERRTEYLQARGLRVMRFWNNQVLAETEAVLDEIWRALTPTLSQRERE